MSGRLRRALCLIAAALAFGAAPALAAPGDLDPTFGVDHNGKQLIDLGDREGVAGDGEVAVQPDRKIVFVGSTLVGSPAGVTKIVVERLLPNGLPDLSFSGDGGAVIPIAGPQGGIGRGVAIQPDGKIVVVGQAGTTGKPLVLRLAPDGTLDPTFGAGGVQTTLPSKGEIANAVALQADGKIVLAGRTLEALDGKPGDLWIARLNPDGSPDTTFDGDAQQTAGVAGDDRAWAVAIQPGSQKIVAAGEGSANDDMLAIRLNTNGSLDTGFGPFGNSLSTVHVAGRTSRAFAIAVEPDGQIDLAGSNGSGNFMVARLNSNGMLDTGFGTSGTGWTGLSAGGDEFAEGLALQPDGRIVVGGEGGPNGDLLALRLNPDGTQDRAFGNGSFNVGTADFGGTEYGGDIALDPAGQVVAVGGTQDAQGAPLDFAIARFDGDTPPPPPAKCHVPDVVGKRVGAAKDAIRSRNCAAGSVTRERAPRSDRGRVIEQHPKGGRTFAAGKEIALVVGKHPQRRHHRAATLHAWPRQQPTAPHPSASRRYATA